KIVKNSSIIFGLVDHKKKLIAFSRVLTDYFLFSYVYDVLVDNEYQGLGLGRCLIEEIIHYPALQNVQNIELVCSKEMMRFYKKFGFSDSYGKSVSMRFVRGHK
ncbi:MAG: GNAT family N-acetyltransferase, partial [Francisellaceae bacterium]|nr:GNAT family N-acetyltransferase [Francisellaceae bacterium]